MNPVKFCQDQISNDRLIAIFVCSNCPNIWKFLSVRLIISNTNEDLFPIIYTCIYYNAFTPMNHYNLQQSLQSFNHAYRDTPVARYATRNNCFHTNIDFPAPVNFWYLILGGFHMLLVCLRQYAGRNLQDGFLLFLAWKLPIIIQQKPIFQIFKKSNMAAIITIIMNNLQLKYRKVCAGWNLWGRFFIFYMKLTYNRATKTHIINF